ncbi:Glutamate-cysteine ligase catalytic subunit [Mycena kentingensis (nom. inval.)]|nr:Glutamate-cysteine ligase catalytic subunit [Mycena kentingensis (nom. inval.)]
MSVACQQCKEIIELDPSLADLAPSAYDMIVASLPPTPTRPEPDSISHLKASETARNAWQKAKGASLRSQKKQSSAPLPNESFVLLQDSIVRSIPSPAPSPSSKKASTTSRTSSGRTQSPPRTEVHPPNPPPMTPHPRSTVRLFNLLSARTDIDHPLCAECTQVLLNSLQRQLDETKRERDGYIAFEKEVRKERERDAQGMSKEEAEKKIEKLKLDERLAIDQLKVAEQERMQLEDELRALEEEEKALEEEEARFWRTHNEQLLSSDQLSSQLETIRAAYAADSATLEKLERTNVYNDAFCIGHDGVFGTINGLRLGRVPGVPVEWAEINAAWGQSLLLLYTIARKLDCTFEHYRLVPMGSFSRIEKTTGDKASYELYSSGNLSMLQLLHNRRFDLAMVAFLECLKQVMDYIKTQDAGVDFPHQIIKDRIGDVSIKLKFNQDEAWTSLYEVGVTIDFLMGLLDGDIEHVRYHGITQFLHIWDKLKDRHGDELLWGDEVEYMVVAMDDTQKTAKLSLRQTEILEKLSSIVNDISSECADSVSVPTFHPEYGRYMLEATPGSPYTGSIPDLLSVEGNMRYRRVLARKHLKPNEIPLTVTSFPLLGVPGPFTEPYFDPVDAKSSHSLFLPEEITNPHVRFPTLTANIRQRRGSKVAINLPIFFDTNTPRPFVDPTIPWERAVYPEDHEAKDGAALTDHIYLDAMGFGMGCCCLQLTFQACHVNDARRMYDCLIPIGPILLALTAASPIWRGYLADVDCRWNVIAGSVDDRTEEERGLKPLKESRFQIPKSRYDSVDLYISSDWRNRPEYNDNPLPYDESIYTRLREHGIDDLLAKHVSHLFIRDPLVVFTETLDQDDAESSDHFENIQSTNWQTLRFKPPPPKSSIGWRVEFRSMEVQMTDFENAAFAVFVVLLSRAILTYNTNFYIPISKVRARAPGLDSANKPIPKVDENMARAQKRDAAQSGKFFFRKNVSSPPSSAAPSSCNSGCSSPIADTMPVPIPIKDKKMRNCFPDPPLPESDSLSMPVDDEYEEMSMDEIINGKGADFPGLLGLINTYLETLDMEPDERSRIDAYLDLVRRRANGALLTPATWIRNFVRAHPAYKHDSVVNAEINYDLIVAIDEIERGVRKADDLLPSDYTGSKEDAGSIGLQS